MTTETLPTEVKIAAPSSAELSKGASAALQLVNEFEITDAPTFEIAADELKSIKAKATALEERRKALTQPLDAVKKGIMDLFRGPLDLLGQAEGILKSKMLTFQQAEQRKAEEQRLLAEKAAQEERARLQAEADALAAQGRAGEAVVKETVAQMIVAAPVAAPAVPQVKGIATTKTIDFEVVDLHALIVHVAAHPELVNLLNADSVKLRAFVKGLGMACNLPGVRVFEKQGLSASRK